jgi:hypothetical protein
MKNHPAIGKLVMPVDRPALMNLTNITSKLHDKGFGFDLIFHFKENDYFNNTTMVKSYYMPNQ